MSEFALKDITLEALRKAQARIQPYVSRTPMRRWNWLGRQLHMEAPVFLKVETFQNTGSFKVRGAANKMLSLIESGNKPSCVIAASAGNHAQGVAFMAGRLGIPSRIVMPEGAPLVKAEATSDYGAEVISHGLIYDEAFQKAQELLRTTAGSVYVHAYEDPDVIIGQGTMGLEIDAQLKEFGVDAPDLQVVVPIGGGGLFSGVGAALTQLRPQTTMYGVVSAAAPAMAESLKKGSIVEVTTKRPRTIAEGLAVKKVSQMTFGMIQKLAKEIAIVNDQEVAGAITSLMERAKLIVEGAGASGVAAALAGKLHLDPKRPVVFVLCGGNIDMNLLSNILERGFVSNGRWLNLSVVVEDRPGELAKLTGKIAELRGNVLEVNHDRNGPHCSVGQTIIRLQVETRGPAHVKELLAALQNAGYITEVLTQ